jgi:hypothetical protein
VHESVHDFNTLLHIGNSVQRRVDHIYHHDLHFFNDRPELVVMLMPRRVLNVENDILDLAQLEQVTIECGLDLAKALRDLGSLLAAEYRQLLLLALFRVREVNLTVTDLRNFIMNFKVNIAY